MRIAFYSDNLYPELSGIADTIVTTGKELLKRGHQVVYAGPYYSPRDWAKANRPYPRSPQEDAIDGMPVVRLHSYPMRPSPTGQSRFVIPTGESLAFMRDFKPDLIHTQSPYGTGLEAARIARRLGVPLVGTNHTDVTDFYPIGTRTLMRRWDARYYNRCVLVAAPYGRLIERMREVGFTKPAEVIPNPADLHEFTAPSPSERADAKKALGAEGLVLLYVGRLGVEKRVDVMLRAMPLLLREFPTLTFIATGHGAARAGLERLARQLGITSRVRFTGFVSRAALGHIYRAADLFGMTSTSDSQSLALMQAYASGLPAVCARARGLPDYTPSDCGFLVEPNNPEEFAAASAGLLRERELRERMGRAAVHFVSQFSPEVIAAKWEETYARALGR
jgi:glycosyltransferase involved in cell wall biosynthesis